MSTTMLLMETAPTRLVLAALLGIAVIVVLITKFKLHPFLSLTLGALVVGLSGGMMLAAMLKSFSTGVGNTVASVGVLIALGAIVGKLLADSGGADAIVDRLVGGASARSLPWMMALTGALIGLPMFFEIGLVLLVPVIVLVAKRTRMPIMRVGIPALAGLSTMHALVPPHPGPLAAVGLLKADLGITLGLGVLVAIPTVIVAGPLFSRLAARWVPVQAPDLFTSAEAGETGSGIAPRRPSFGITLLTVLLPVVLMMGKAIADVTLAAGNPVRDGLDFIGEPLLALLATALLAMFTLGRTSGMSHQQVTESISNALPPIAGIILIVGAGGGFKQVLVDSGVGKMLADWITDGRAQGGQLVVMALIGWLVAVVIRLATGSATVATLTSAGILAPAMTAMTPVQASVVVLAVGCGSVFFSHVNDAGFWLVKEYFGTTVGENIKTWSLMETVLSVTGLLLVLPIAALLG